MVLMPLQRPPVSLIRKSRFNVKKPYIALCNGTSVAQPPHQSEFLREGGRGGRFFQKAPPPLPKPHPLPAKTFDLIESLLLGLPML